MSLIDQTWHKSRYNSVQPFRGPTSRDNQYPPRYFRSLIPAFFWKFLFRLRWVINAAKRSHSSVIRRASLPNNNADHEIRAVPKVTIVRVFGFVERAVNCLLTPLWTKVSHQNDVSESKKRFWTREERDVNREASFLASLFRSTECYYVKQQVLSWDRCVATPEDLGRFSGPLRDKSSKND